MTYALLFAPRRDSNWRKDVSGLFLITALSATRCCSSEPQVVTAQLVDRPAAHQLHVPFDFGIQIFESPFDAGLTRGRQGIQIKSPSRTRFCAHGKGFQNVRAPGNAPVANDICLITDSVDYLGKLVERAPRPVELPPAMIGHHDSGRADLHGTLCVRNAHNALKTELFAPFLANTLGVLPVHRLVEHRAEIVADGYRDVRTLLHLVLQLGQLELLVTEIVDRPSRVQGEAEEAPERQARGRSEAGPQIALPISAGDRVDGQRQHVEIRRNAALDHAVG